MEQDQQSSNKKAPEGMKTFSIYREDKPGPVEHLLEGVQFSGGTCVINWLDLTSKGSIAIWDSLNVFIDSFVKNDPNHTHILIFSDGQRLVFRPEGSSTSLPNVEEEIEALFRKAGKGSKKELFRSLHALDELMETATDNQIEAIVEEFLRAYSKGGKEPNGQGGGHGPGHGPGGNHGQGHGQGGGHNGGDGKEGHESKKDKKDDHKEDKQKGKGK